MSNQFLLCSRYLEDFRETGSCRFYLIGSSPCVALSNQDVSRGAGIFLAQYVSRVLEPFILPGFSRVGRLQNIREHQSCVSKQCEREIWYQVSTVETVHPMKLTAAHLTI